MEAFQVKWIAIHRWLQILFVKLCVDILEIKKFTQSILTLFGNFSQLVAFANFSTVKGFQLIDPLLIEAFLKTLSNFDFMPGVIMGS